MINLYFTILNIYIILIKILKILYICNLKIKKGYLI